MVAQGPAMILERSIIRLPPMTFMKVARQKVINFKKQYKISMTEKEKMPQWLKVSFRIMYGVDEWANKYRWLPILCRFSEVAVLMYFQIVKTFIDLTIELLNAPIPNYDITYQLFYLTGISLLLSLPLFSYEYIQYNDLGAVEERKTLSQIIHWCLIFLLYLNYILYTMVAYYLWKKINNIRESTSFKFDLLVVFTLALMFIFQTVLFTSRRLYGWITPLIVPLFIYFTARMRAFVIIILTIPLLYKENRFDVIFDHKLVFVTGFWSALALFEVVYEELLLQITLIILLVFTAAHHFLTCRPIETLSTQEQIELMLNFYQEEIGKQPQLQDEQIFHFNHEQAFLYQKYLNESDLSRLDKAQQASELQFTEWGLLKKQVLWQRILQEKQQNPSIQISVTLFQAAFIFKQNQLSSLYDLQKLYRENEEKGIRFKYWIYYISQNIMKREQKNEESQQNNLKIADFIRAQTSYRQFYELIDKLLTKLLQFWREIHENQSVVTQKAHKYLQDIKKCYQKLAEKESELKGFKIPLQLHLFELITSLVNCYSLNKDLEREEEQVDVKEVSFEYLFIKSQKITKISLKLLKQLGYQLEDIIHERLDAFLPKNYGKYVEEQCQHFLNNHQQTTIMLPILTKNNSFIMKQCKIHIVLEENTPSFVFILENWQKNVPMLLLNLNKQTVQGINSQLRQFANIKTSILKQFFQNSNCLLFNSIFGTQLTENDQQALNRGEKIKTNFSSTNELQPKKKVVNRNKQEIDLHPIRPLTVGPQNWMIIKLTLSVGSLDFAPIQQENKIQEKHLHHEITLEEKYANETFFCPIQSPYKSKILEKLSHQQKISVKSYCCLLSAINILALVLFLAFVIIDFILDPTDYEQIKDIRDINNQYICLLRMYSNTYSHTFFTENQTNTKTYLNSVFYDNTANSSTVSELYTSFSEYYLTRKELNIKQFTSTYLLKKNIEGYTPISYNLSFSSYQIETNTLYSTFYDFISFPEGIEDNSIDFLVTNYPNLIHVFPAYQQHHNDKIKLSQNYTLFQITIKVTTITVAVLLFIELILAGKSVRVYREIKNIFRFVEKPDVEAVLKNLDHVKMSIGEICVNEYKIKERDSYHQISTSFRGVMEEELEDSPPIKFLPSFHLSEQKEFQEISWGQTFLSFFKQSYLSTLILLTIFLISKFEDAGLESQSLTYKSIVSLLQKYQTEEMYMQRLYTELFQNHYYFNLKGVNFTSDYPTVTKLDFNDEMLPEVMKLDIISNENLCDQIYYSDITVPGFNHNEEQCREVAEGILTKGFSEALEVFQSYLRELFEGGYDNYLLETSRLKQIIYFKAILGNFLKIKQQDFLQNLEKYEKQKQSREIVHGLLLLLIGLAIIVLIVFYVYTQFTNRKVMGSFVRIIPTNVMYRVQTANYIRKKEILDKIEGL